MEKILQAQAKSSLAKSRNQDEDPCPNLPEMFFMHGKIETKCLILEINLTCSWKEIFQLKFSSIFFLFYFDLTELYKFQFQFLS